MPALDTRELIAEAKVVQQRVAELTGELREIREQVHRARAARALLAFLEFDPDLTDFVDSLDPDCIPENH